MTCFWTIKKWILKVPRSIKVLFSVIIPTKCCVAKTLPNSAQEKWSHKGNYLTVMGGYVGVNYT